MYIVRNHLSKHYQMTEHVWVVGFHVLVINFFRDYSMDSSSSAATISSSLL